MSFIGILAGIKDQKSSFLTIPDGTMGGHVFEEKRHSTTPLLVHLNMVNSSFGVPSCLVGILPIVNSSFGAP
jgi:hypothetical protein